MKSKKTITIIAIALLFLSSIATTSVFAANNNEQKKMDAR
jgi:hypothetical protein